MRILFILEYYHPHIGGVERLFSTLAESLASHGHQVTVLTTRHSPSLPKTERKNKVLITRIDVSSRYAFTFLAAPQAYFLAKRHDLVHTTSYNAAVPAFIAGKLTGKPIVITFHEVWGRLWFFLPFLNWGSRISFYLYEQFVLRLPLDRWVAVSDYTRGLLRSNGIREEKLSRIYNGVEYSITKPQTQVNKTTFTYFGRLGVSKGIEVFLRAAAELHQEGEIFHLQLIFPKEPLYLRRKIMQLIAKLNLGNIITIRHNLSESELKIRLLESLCVIVPSHTEGFGFSALEACTLGIPVISSGRGALPEVVSGKNIQLDELTTAHLKNAMSKALKEEWKEVPLKRFELSETVGNYQKIYNELLGEQA